MILFTEKSEYCQNLLKQNSNLYLDTCTLTAGDIGNYLIFLVFIIFLVAILRS